MKNTITPKFIDGQWYFYHWGYWCIATKMQFVVEGVKAKPHSEYISEVDLLVDSKKSIRARQRQKLTMVRLPTWENISDPGGKRYNRAIIQFCHIFAN